MKGAKLLMTIIEVAIYDFIRRVYRDSCKN